MARQFDWQAIRAQFEAGVAPVELGRVFGVSCRSIQYHRAAEQWRAPAAKVLSPAGMVWSPAPGAEPEALAVEVRQRARVLARQRREWLGHGRLLQAAIRAKDAELAKLAKLTAEALAIRQAGERKAWGLDGREAVGAAGSLGEPTLIVSPIVPDEAVPERPVL